MWRPVCRTVMSHVERKIIKRARASDQPGVEAAVQHVVSCRSVSGRVVVRHTVSLVAVVARPLLLSAPTSRA
jgi:hypothetical protein